MKRLLFLVITAGLLLMPLAAYAAEKGSPPPVSQSLVREGDYAVDLVKALNIGSVEDETQAEDILAAAGIAPNSGWISDFPVTPDIIAEIQASIDTAADEGRLPMAREDAESAFFALNAEVGLSITPAASSEQANEPAAPATDPAVINNYYYDEGPPVITYYPPPPDYYYLYAWDPFPFWCGGFFFPGFFVLSDFNFVFFDRDDFFFHGHHHHHHDGDHRFVTNHVVDPISKRSVAIDPVMRRPLSQTAFRPVGARGSFDPVARTGGTHDRTVLGNVRGRSFDRTSATNLLGRSVSRDGVVRNTNRAGTRTGAGAWNANRGTAATRAGRQWQWTGTETPSRAAASRPDSGVVRSFNRPAGGGRSIAESGRSFGGSFSGRSFSAPSVNSGRTFSAPPRGGGRSIAEVGRSFGGSFNSPSFGGGGRSFSAPSGGGGGRSFGGGGRSFSAPSGGGGGRSGGGFGGMRGR